MKHFRKISKQSIYILLEILALMQTDVDQSSVAISLLLINILY